MWRPWWRRRFRILQAMTHVRLWSAVSSNAPGPHYTLYIVILTYTRSISITDNPAPHAAAWSSGESARRCGALVSGVLNQVKRRGPAVRGPHSPATPHGPGASPGEARGKRRGQPTVRKRPTRDHERRRTVRTAPHRSVDWTPCPISRLARSRQRAHRSARRHVEARRTRARSARSEPPLLVLEAWPPPPGAAPPPHAGP